MSQGLEALPHLNYLGAQVIAAGMAPHLTGKEQEQLMEWRRKGCTPIEIHAKLVGCRGGKGIKAPDLTVVRKFLKGKTHRRGGNGDHGRGQKDHGRGQKDDDITTGPNPKTEALVKF